MEQKICFAFRLARSEDALWHFQPTLRAEKLRVPRGLGAWCWQLNMHNAHSHKEDGKGMWLSVSFISIHSSTEKSRHTDHWREFQQTSKVSYHVAELLLAQRRGHSVDIQEKVQWRVSCQAVKLHVQYLSHTLQLHYRNLQTSCT